MLVLTFGRYLYSNSQINQAARVLFQCIQASAKGKGFDLPVEILQYNMPSKKVSSLKEAANLLNSEDRVKQYIIPDAKSSETHCMEAYYCWLKAM